MPKVVRGQFNNLKIGGQEVVIYREKGKHTTQQLFVATQLPENSGYSITTTKTVDLEHTPGHSALVFAEGRSYILDQKDQLKYAIRFDKSRIPIHADFSKMLDGKYKYLQMTSPELWWRQNGRKKSWHGVFIKHSP